jgi:AmmeMemoRadiSam system protein B
MWKFAARGLIIFQLLCGCGPGGTGSQGCFPPLYPEPGLFLRAVRQARSRPLDQKITGLTVPHHLLAVDLMAESFNRLRHQHYRRVILLSPDHFKRGRTRFSVTRKDFQTVFGKVVTDRTAISQLLANRLVSVSELFSHEHGVQALLPFLAYYFPGVKLVAIAIHPAARPADWDSLARTLTPLISPDTLLIQSTDFSHYLPWAEAQVKDQETLRILSGGDPEAVISLREPGHLDCRAAQYLQLRLQKEIFQARPTVMAHRNSQEYAAEALARTTSYLVQFYSREPLWVENGERVFFAGDTFFGRSLAKVLATGERREALVEEILKITRGAGLIVNLEGVVGEKGSASEPYKLGMEAAFSLEILKRINTRAVSLANNHSHDYGAEAYRQMKQLLTSGGLEVLENHSVTDLGRFRLVAFTDVDNRQKPRAARLREADLKCLDRLKPGKPLFAWVHWGREYARGPGPREKLVAVRLADQGVELIIGSHSHRASSLTAKRDLCQVFSLGNFIFDQRRPEVSGALLEVTFLPSGAYFLRLHPLGNLYAKLLIPAPDLPGPQAYFRDFRRYPPFPRRPGRGLSERH